MNMQQSLMKASPRGIVTRLWTLALISSTLLCLGAFLVVSPQTKSPLLQENRPLAKPSLPSQ